MVATDIDFRDIGWLQPILCSMPIQGAAWNDWLWISGLIIAVCAAITVSSRLMQLAGAVFLICAGIGVCGAIAMQLRFSYHYVDAYFIGLPAACAAVTFAVSAWIARHKLRAKHK